MMPYDTLSDTLTHDSPAARRVSTTLVWIAGLALVGNCLLSSPSAFSDAHKNDGSLLKTIVSALALAGPGAEHSAFPTARGVEIRNFVYFMAAALLTIAGALRLLTTTARPRLTAEELWDFKARAGSPLFWGVVLLLISAVTSFLSSHAPDVSFGGVVLRFMQAAWWWPIALLLLPVHARRLTLWLVVAVTACTALGIWYFTARVSPDWWNTLASFHLPDRRMEYPIGNSLWFGACILPAVFAAIGLALDTFFGSRAGGGAESIKRSPITGLVAVAAVAITLLGLILSQSRSSAWVGFAAGVAFMVMIIAKRNLRPAVMLVALVIALVGVWKIQSLRETGVMGERAHSIRSRLNYEWPYAITLFKAKPVGGNGEGGYAMLASGIAREDQLDDPSTRAMSERWWFFRAHNEFLELLADLGIVGAAAFLLALVFTLFHAIRYCDHARSDPESRPFRWLAVGLSAALFGMILEECSSVALREPGFPPIFLTVWALLWAIIRIERIQVTQPQISAVVPTTETPPPADSPDGKPSPEGATSPTPPEPRLGNGVFRGLGAAALAMGFALVYYGYHDWIAIQSNQSAQVAIAEEQYDVAAQKADYAGEHLLDPFLKLTARMFAVEARTRAFQKAVAAEEKPTDETLRQAAVILNALGTLNKAAPRFLRVSRLATEVFRTLVHAAQLRGERDQAQFYLKEYQAALAQSFNDDPFDTAIVIRMWREIPQADARERMRWLRSLMRRGEMDDATRAMAESLFRQIPGAGSALNELGVVADADFREEAALSWTDRLSPETFRLAALIKDLSGDAPGAVELAKSADKMYTTAGPRLFSAQAAAIREGVIYRLHVDPTSQTDALLDELVRSIVIMDGPMPASVKEPRLKTLPRQQGETRALVLAAAGREEEARAQLAALAPADASAPAPTLAGAYAVLAEQFAPKIRFADLAMKWALRARELDDNMPAVHYTLLGLYLEKGDEENALQAARRLVETTPNRDQAMNALQQCEMRSPQSGVWARLRKEIPDFPEMPIDTTVKTTTEPATSPAGTEAMHGSDGPPEAPSESSTTMPSE